MKRELTCIGCPMGCLLRCEINGEELAVSGNTCPRGEKYAKTEITSPMRTVTSTVAILGGVIPRLPVRTAADIPKNRIMECMEEIRKIRAEAPVAIGAVLLKNCAGTNVDIIATRSIDRK